MAAVRRAEQVGQHVVEVGEGPVAGVLVRVVGHG